MSVYPLKFILGPLILYPQKVPTKAMPSTIARLVDGRIGAISVLQHPLYYMRQVPWTPPNLS